MKLGVNMDCYRQSLFAGSMTADDVFGEIGSISGVTGIDATAEALIPEYPEISDRFLAVWQENLDKYSLEPVTLGSTTDRLRFRTHVMDVEETADALRMDLGLAHRLGFRNLRITHDIPLEAVELVLPQAQEWDIILLDELMPPGSIRPQAGRKGMDCTRDLELIARTETKHFGFVVNLGLFQTEPNPTQILDVLLETKSSLQATVEFEEIMASFHSLHFEDFEAWMAERYPQLTANRELFGRMFGVRIPGESVPPQDLKLIAPYIYDVYAKYIFLTSEPRSPMDWVEPSIPYSDVIWNLKDAGYGGYLTSLRMSAPTLSLGRDRTPEDISAEETSQVRRHQEMLQYLI